MMMTKPCNKQVDVYSYGVLLWELMTYCKPWDSLADNAQILSAITKGEVCARYLHSCALLIVECFSVLKYQSQRVIV